MSSSGETSDRAHDAANAISRLAGPTISLPARTSVNRRRTINSKAAFSCISTCAPLCSKQSNCVNSSRPPIVSLCQPYLPIDINLDGWKSARHPTHTYLETIIVTVNWRVMRSAVSRIKLSSNKLLQTTTLDNGLVAALSNNRASQHNLDNQCTRRHYSTRLAEVGRFEDKLADENCYPAGQPFLHRIFGYRGVTLFPWLARVHDVDLRKQYSETSGTLTGSQLSGSNLDESHHRRQDKGYPVGDRKHKRDKQAPSPAPDAGQNNASGNTVDCEQDSGYGDPLEEEATKFTNPRSTRFHPYYQVLIDTRDCPYVSNRTQTEAVTFLGHPDNSKSVYSIKGLDYVAHEDILPYTSVEEQPIRHELHKKLFRYDPETPVGSPKYLASDLLDSWRSKHPWLELSRVYKETTENVRVTVIPFYLGHTTIEDTSFHWWRYCVRLENFSDMSIQLRERHWKIFSQTNMLQTIKGRGVVGVEPLLTRSEPAYQYSSHVNLQDKSGHMWGTFKMQREDGYTFECRIPPFSLESSISASSASGPPNPAV